MHALHLAISLATPNLASRPAGPPATAGLLPSPPPGGPLAYANLSVLVPLTAFGCLLSLLYQHSGNLLTPIAAHVTFNTAPFVLLALDIRLDR